MSGERLAALLARRLREEGIGPDAAVSVAEIRRQLLPYPYCRERLELASKAEYDLAMLELLGDAALLEVEDPELEEAVEREAGAPEPGLGFLEDFAAVQIRPGPALSGRVTSGGGPDGGSEHGPEGGSDDGSKEGPDGESEGGPEGVLDGGRPADIGPTGGERPVRLVDESADGAPAEGATGGDGDPGADDAPGADEASSDETAVAGSGAPISDGSCRACGGDLPPRDDLRFCPWCGADQQTRSCEGCGAEIQSGWNYCPECGEPTDG